MARGRYMGKNGGQSGERIRGGIIGRIVPVFLFAFFSVCIAGELLGRWRTSVWQGSGEGQAVEVTADGNYIKWVELHVTCEALAAAYDLDVETYKDKVHINWIELLAYEGARTGGRFDTSSVKKIKETAEKLRDGMTTMEELTKDMEYYDYYLEAYTAVLGGMVGEFTLDGKRVYGLKAFSPIAKGFDYSHYDDFGSSRSYGYARPHLGHDMMGQIGTPIRIKYRTCASKNDTQVFFFQYAFLHDLANQFVFRSIFYRIKIVKKKADVSINLLFSVLKCFGIVFTELSLSESILKAALAFVQLLDLGDDVGSGRRIHGCHE